jgi:hypothetical protein
MLGAPRPARATDIVVCNDGDIDFSIATATRQGDGLFFPRSWYVEGWFAVQPDACTTFPDHTDEPIYVAVAYTDDADVWGAGEFTMSREDSSWRRVESDLCVADGAFAYSHGNDFFDGPCDAGYFHFPAALYLEPSGSTSRYTLTLGIEDGQLAKPPEEHVASESTGNASGRSYEGGKSFGDKLIDGFWQALADAARDSQRRSNGGGSDATNPRSGGDASTDRSADESPTAEPAAVEPTPLGPPRPLEPGTLTAGLFGAPIVRRVGGDGEWFDAGGARVSAVYQLDGVTSDDILDPPKQHEDGDAAVATALSALSAGIAGFAANRGAQVTNDGRLFYTYSSDVGIRHDAVDLVALDLANADPLTGGDGYTGLVISCRKFDPCVVAWGEDEAGKPKGVELYGAVRIFAPNDTEREKALGALRELQGLFPAEPAVEAR